MNVETPSLSKIEAIDFQMEALRKNSRESAD
jgi:hypothetical protein